MNKDLFELIQLDDESIIYFSRGVNEFSFSEDEFSEIWNSHPEQFHIVKMYGRELLTPRWQQAYGKDYSYSGSKNNALPILGGYEVFLEWAQKNIDSSLNGLLLNWYDGQQGHYIGPHRDDTRNLINRSPIVTISIGQERVFRMRKYRAKVSKDILLNSGDVIVIPWETNLKWTHEVPKFKKYTGRRVSVTLRAYL